MELAEHIKTATVERVVLTRPFQAPARGALCLTGHHLLFSGRDGDGDGDRGRQLLLLLRSVDAVEKRTVASSGTITLKCKDLCVLQLDIPGMEECLNIASSVEVGGLLTARAPSAPLSTRRNLECLPFPSQDKWRVSHINSDYSVCPTYPAAVIVPRTVDDQTLVKAAQFRQGGRFPVLCYYHQKNGTVIMRSSQPLPGANRKRCRDDELLLQAVIDGSEVAYIIDTRSGQQAQQARMTGGGFESKTFYNSWKRLHRHLERGKVLQESLIKLVEACSDQSHSVDRWLSKLENSKWLTHIHSALSTAGLVAECVERDGHSVLIHGFEGTDSTLLVTTLAQLILDPDARTLRGFLALLEREWVQAGHPFQLRCAHSAYSHTRLKQESPVFLLMLDCVWQLCRQFPLAMEVGEPLLLRLAQEAYASNYGTFLCNSEQERCAVDIKTRTHCLFQFLLRPDKRDEYINPLYQPTHLAIWPSVQPQSLHLWWGFFLRWTDHAQNMAEAREVMWRIVAERFEDES
uniref:Myotubularin phosphatase domain-containing protein n=1 Tax=Denticeps clupeoides TaxID=299321 RepID=A0AAY4AF21_9TELE